MGRRILLDPGRSAEDTCIDTTMLPAAPPEATNRSADRRAPVPGPVAGSPSALADGFRHILRSRDEDALAGALWRVLPHLLRTERLTVGFRSGPRELAVRRFGRETGRQSEVERVTYDPRTSTSTPAEVLGTSDAPDRPAPDLVIDVSVLVDGMLSGIIRVECGQGEYRAEDRHLMVGVADLVGLALERIGGSARRNEELALVTRHLRLLEVLGELGRSLATVSTIDRAYLTTVDHLVKLVRATRISLSRPDADDQKLRLSIIHQDGETPSTIDDGMSMQRSGTAGAAVFDNKQVLHTPDISESGYPEHMRLAAAGYASAVSIPVLHRGEVLAVMNFASTIAGSFNTEDQLAAEAMLVVLGGALHRIAAADRAAARNRHLATILDESPLLMLTLDHRGVIQEASRHGARLMGFEAARLVSQHVVTLYPAEQQDSLRSRLRELTRQPVDETLTWEAPMLQSRVAAPGDAAPTSQRMLVRHTARRLDDGAAPAAILLVCEDISGQVEVDDQLDHDATHDALTGLVNRMEFESQLDTLLRERHAGFVGSVLYLDIDHFKNINDTASHRAGDALLQLVAEALQQCLNRRDTIGRIGGDEFAVLLPGCSLANAVRVAERLRTAAGNLVFSWSGRTYGVSVSIGIVSIDAKTATPSSVLQRADAACFDAKQEGRNRVSVAAADRIYDRSTRSDGEWGTRLRSALANGHLRLAVQDILPVGGHDGKVRVEVLVRLQEPDGQLLPAGAFIPPAERLGLVTEIDHWVVDQVAQLMIDHPELVRHVDFIAMNLSAASIESDDFLNHLVETFASPGVDASTLLFEITESSALSQFSKAVRFIETVSAVGCRFALDDFGAGFSTFHWLRRLPVDYLKIDGSLIKNLANDQIDRSIVQSIAQVATSLRMKTIAEFVDGEETVKALQEIGVDYAQGYGLARPLVMDQYLAAMTERVMTAGRSSSRTGP